MISYICDIVETKKKTSKFPPFHGKKKLFSPFQNNSPLFCFHQN